MRRCKRTVKRLNAEFPGVFSESLLIHEREGAEPADIGIVQSSTIVEIHPQSRVFERFLTESAVVDEQRTREPRLHDDTLAGVEVDHYQLRPPPAAHDSRVAQPSRQRPRAYFPENVCFPNRDSCDGATTDRGVQIARDRLGLR
jgi:hypothetical protein